MTNPKHGEMTDIIEHQVFMLVASDHLSEQRRAQLIMEWVDAARDGGRQEGWKAGMEEAARIVNLHERGWVDQAQRAEVGPDRDIDSKKSIAAAVIWSAIRARINEADSTPTPCRGKD